jgi:hypothetical protein
MRKLIKGRHFSKITTLPGGLAISTIQAIHSVYFGISITESIPWYPRAANAQLSVAQPHCESTLVG